MKNSNPTIIHAIDTTGPGGAETVFLDIVEKLRVPGYRNLAIIKGSGWVEDQLRAREINYRVIKPRGFLSLPYYAELFLLLKKENVALIQAHLLGSTLTYSILSLILRLPLIATLHGRVDINPKERFVAVKQWIMQKGVNRLIAVSNDLASYIESRKLFKASDIDVIYNGINIENYKINSLPAERFGLPRDCLVLGALGNIRPAKDYANAIRALAFLKNTDRLSKSVHLVIAGHLKTELHKDLLKEAESLDVTDRVHFLGFQQNTPDFLHRIDVFMLSSSSEGFSIATLEAMAARKPVVATRCGGPEEILTHGVNGHLVSVQDSAALAEGIIKLLSEADYANQLINAARQHVESHFSLKAMLDNYARHYEALLNISAESALTMVQKSYD